MRPCLALSFALACGSASAGDPPGSSEPVPAAAPRPSQPAPAPVRAGEPAAGSATIHDPRSCEPDQPLSPKATWKRVPGIDDAWGATMGFTGGKLFLFLRDRKSKHHGLRIDPKTRAVQPFDATPLAEGEPRLNAARMPEVRCIAGELVFWGDASRHRAWGAIYNPARGAWRKIQPYGSPASSVSATDGKRLYVFEPGGEHGISGAAYDPETDRWLPMAPGPALGLALLATPLFLGGKMILWGCKNGDNSCPGAVYDPIANTWQPIPPTPAAIAQEPGIRHQYPLLLGDSMFLLVESTQGPRLRMLRLGADRRWSVAREVPAPFQAEQYALVGGRHQGFLWTRTWNEPSPPRYRAHRLRIAPDLSTTEIAKPPDPSALPSNGPSRLEEASLLQAAGSLFVNTRVYSDTGNSDHAVWILN